MSKFDTYPSDIFFQYLNTRYQLSEAGFIAGAAAASNAAISLFGAVWNHNIPQAVAAGGLAVAGTAAIRVFGARAIDTINHKIGSAIGLASHVATLEGISETTAKAISDASPGARLVEKMLPSVNSRPMYQAMAAAVSLGEGLAAAGAPDLKTAMVHGCAAIAGLVTASVLHRRQSNDVNNLVKAAYGHGLRFFIHEFKRL